MTCDGPAVGESQQFGRARDSETADVLHITVLHRANDVRIAHKECLSLARAGFTIALVAPRDDAQPPTEVPLIPIARIRRRGRRFLIGGMQVARAIVRSGARAIHIHDPELIPLACIFLVAGRQVVYDMHENLPGSLDLKPWLPPSLRAIVKFAIQAAERCVLPHLHIVLAEDAYKTKYAWLRDVTVVRNFPRFGDLPRRRDIARTESFALCYVGAISSERGSLDMLSVLRELTARGHRVRLDLAGPVDKQHLDHLLQLGSDIGDGSVRYYGLVPPLEAYAIVAGAGVGLSLLHRHENYETSLATKILDYMGVGIPVIASDFRINREILVAPSAGWCFEPSNWRGIANAIESVIVTPGLRESMGDRGRDAVRRNFTWERESEVLVAMYQTKLQLRAGGS